MPKQLRAAYWLSIAVAALMAVCSAAGLFVAGLYRDNTLVTSAWKGTDLVTLAVAVPLMIWALAAVRRGSVRAVVVWVAMLAYAVYNYAFYLFGAAFNALFLGYVALFALSLYALVFLLPYLDVEAIKRSFSPKMPRWPVVGYLLFTAAGLGLLWTGWAAASAVAGTVPQPVIETGHPTAVVFALDLSLIVPALVLGGVWLLQRRAWGYLLAAVYCVKGAVYGLALTSSSLWAQRAGIEAAGAQIPLWAGLTVLALIACAVVFANVRGTVPLVRANAAGTLAEQPAS